MQRFAQLAQAIEDGDAGVALERLNVPQMFAEEAFGRRYVATLTRQLARTEEDATAIPPRLTARRMEIDERGIVEQCGAVEATQAVERLRNDIENVGKQARLAGEVETGAGQALFEECADGDRVAKRMRRVCALEQSDQQAGDLLRAVAFLLCRVALAFEHATLRDRDQGERDEYGHGERARSDGSRLRRTNLRMR